MTDLKSFLEHNVEGYLFEDLRRMKRVDVGYPMIMTAFAGIELLGALLSLRTFGTRAGSLYFRSYWSNYLYPSRANTQQQGNCVYQLARHGIAHAYFLKGPIVVVTAKPLEHLTAKNGFLQIDRIQLADDLIDSYDRSVRPMVDAPVLATPTVGGVDQLTMTDRLSEMEVAYNTQVQTIAQNLIMGNPFPVSTSLSMLGTASGAASQSGATSSSGAPQLGPFGPIIPGGFGTGASGPVAGQQPPTGPTGPTPPDPTATS